MEPDRYNQNHTVYIVGILCLVASLAMIAFSLYLLPYLLFGWHYSVPEFVIAWLDQIQTSYNLSVNASEWLIFAVFFIPGLVFALIADVVSNRIDNQIYGIQAPETTRPKPVNTESRSLLFRIVFIVIVVFIAAQILQWTLTSTS